MICTAVQQGWTVQSLHWRASMSTRYDTTATLHNTSDHDLYTILHRLLGISQQNFHHTLYNIIIYIIRTYIKYTTAPQTTPDIIAYALQQLNHSTMAAEPSNALKEINRQ